MTLATRMLVSVRLPTRTLFEGHATRLVATAANGSFGILPNHVDFVTALVPSVLLVTPLDAPEQVFGIDEGLLVKKGHTVEIVARRGVQSADLESLRSSISGRFAEMEDEERASRTALSRLEADMVRRFANLRRPPHER